MYTQQYPAQPTTKEEGNHSKKQRSQITLIITLMRRRFNFASTPIHPKSGGGGALTNEIDRWNTFFTIVHGT